MTRSATSLKCTRIRTAPADAIYHLPGQFASRLGEPYIFLCKSGLANIATSLIIDEAFAGYFIAGPIVMGELRSSTTKNFANLNETERSFPTMAKMIAGKMKVYQPNQISQIALLFYNCIITSVTGNNDYSALRNQYNEQNKSILTFSITKKNTFL